VEEEVVARQGLSLLGFFASTKKMAPAAGFEPSAINLIF
jgi:hypothetical protein